MAAPISILVKGGPVIIPLVGRSVISLTVITVEKLPCWMLNTIREGLGAFLID